MDHGEWLKAFEADPELEGHEQSHFDLLYTASTLRSAPDSSLVPWPNQVPEPQATSAGLSLEHKAVFDLLCIGTAGSFLHELAHIQFEAAPSRPAARAEESECDIFARQYLIENAAEYASSTSQRVENVVAKRAMGLAITAYTIHQQAPASAYAGSETHPSSAERFRQLVDVSAPQNSDCWTFASSLVISILRQQNLFKSEVVFRDRKELFFGLLDLMPK